MNRRVWAAIPLVPGAVALLAGCAGTSVGETCLEWVLYDTPADAAADADVVVLASAVRAGGTVALWGVRANVWHLEVEAVLAGSMPGVEAGEELEVVSTPRTCEVGGAYPSGNPLETDGPIIALIDDDRMFDVVRTLTPYDGVVAPDPDGGLPDAWPPELPWRGNK